MEFFAAVPSLHLDLQGSTLVVAAVAQGNVGELAMDILITNLDAKLVGYIEDDNVLPCVGNDPHEMSNLGTLSTALELFELPTSSGSGSALGTGPVFLLQQRAPAMLGRQAEFAENLIEWAQSQGVTQLVILCGLDATLRKDKQIVGQVTRYLAGAAPQLAAAAESQGIQQLEEEYLADEREAHGLLPPWPVLAASSRRGLPHLMLGCFAAEGDNVPHAMEVVLCMLQLLGRHTVGQAGAGSGVQGSVAGVPGAPLRMPCSFAALYGRPADAFFG